MHLALALGRGWAATAALPPAWPRGWGEASPWPPGWPNWNAGWPRSSAGRAEASRIAAALAAGGHAPEAFAGAVRDRLARRDAALAAGILAYRRHPFRRALPDPPAVWREGDARLLDFGGGGALGTLLVVPSLINRFHVLDLLEHRSMLRWLAARGGRVLLLDWGSPEARGEADARGFTLTDYVAGRLERALAAAGPLAGDRAGGRVALVGYCMGGLLALALALRRPERVRALALLATPWDFHAPDPGPGRAAAALLPGLAPVLEARGVLPVDALQALFAAVDPYGVAAKFRAFGRLDPAGERARHFVALEDWLNDGVALAAPVAREALGGWYGAGAPAAGRWRVAGEAVVPERLAAPAFVAVPARDRVVPPASALALAARLPGAALHRAPGGHIGMVAGAGAEAGLWEPLRAWLAALPAA